MGVCMSTADSKSQANGRDSQQAGGNSASGTPPLQNSEDGHTAILDVCDLVPYEGCGGLPTSNFRSSIETLVLTNSEKLSIVPSLQSWGLPAHIKTVVCDIYSAEDLGSNFLADSVGVKTVKCPGMDSVTRIGPGLFKGCRSLSSTDLMRCAPAFTNLNRDSIFDSTGTAVPGSGPFTSFSSFQALVTLHTTWLGDNSAVAVTIDVGDELAVRKSKLEEAVSTRGDERIFIHVTNVHGLNTVPSEFPVSPHDRTMKWEAERVLGVKFVDGHFSSVTAVGSDFMSACNNTAWVDLRGLEGVNEVGDHFLWRCAGISTLDLSPLSNVTTVGIQFLRACHTMRQIVGLPTKLKSIPDYFMEGCTRLPGELDLSSMSGATNIGISFLMDCKNLKKVLFPLNVVVVGHYFLYGCSSLRTVDLAALGEATHLGKYFLCGCSALKSLDVTPLRQVTHIGDKFLSECEGLQGVDPAVLRQQILETTASKAAAELPNVAHPPSVQPSEPTTDTHHDNAIEAQPVQCAVIQLEVTVDLSEDAEARMKKLKDVIAGNPTGKTNVVVHITNTTGLAETPDGFPFTVDYRTSDWTSTVSEICFHNSQEFLVVKRLGDNFIARFDVGKLGLSPFCNVTEVGDGFLNRCRRIESIDLTPLHNVTTIGFNFLAECEALKSADLSPLGNVRSAEGRFLAGCTQLESLDMTKMVSLTSIGRSFLDSCVGLQRVLLPPALGENVTDGFLERCTSLQTIDVAPLREVMYVGRNFLSGCSALVALDLSPMKELRYVGSGFLRGCSSLQAAVLTPIRYSKVDKKEMLAGCPEELKATFEPWLVAKIAADVEIEVPVDDYASNRGMEELSTAVSQHEGPCETVLLLLKNRRAYTNVWTGFNRSSYRSGSQKFDSLIQKIVWVEFVERDFLSVSAIGDGFLRDFTGLSHIDLTPLRNVSKIGNGFLAGSTGLVSVELPFLALNRVGDDFLARVQFDQIDLSSLSRLRKLPHGFLSGCTALQQVDLAPIHSVTTIGDGFLEGCSALRAVDCSVFNRVEEIGERFLHGCDRLVGITPQSLRIELLCRAEEEAVFGTNSADAVSIGVVVDISESWECRSRKLAHATARGCSTEGEQKPIAVLVTNYSGADAIPNGFPFPFGGDNSIEDCPHRHIASVVFSADEFAAVTRIGDGFMAHCVSLVGVDLKPLEHVTRIGSNFLYFCVKLQDIDLRPLQQLTALPDNFLGETHSLVHLDVSPLRNVTAVGDGVFASCGVECMWLEHMKSVTTIGDRFLSGCPNLTELEQYTLLPEVKKVGNDFLAGSPRLKDINMIGMKSLVEIGDGFLDGCASIPSLPDLLQLTNITMIGKRFMRGCPALHAFPSTAFPHVTFGDPDWCAFASPVVSKGKPTCSEPRAFVEMPDPKPMKPVPKAFVKVVIDITDSKKDRVAKLKKANVGGKPVALVVTNTTGVDTIPDSFPCDITLGAGRTSLHPTTALQIGFVAFKRDQFRCVKCIGNDFLTSCLLLTEVDMSPLGNVREIGDNFLYNSQALLELDLSFLRNATRIGMCFMQWCERVESLDLEPISHVGQIGSFLHDVGVRSIDLSPLSHWEHLPDYFLHRCQRLKKVDLLPLHNVKTVRACFLAACGLEGKVDMSPMVNCSSFGNSLLAYTNITSLKLPPNLQMATLPTAFCNECRRLKSCDLAPLHRVTFVDSLFMNDMWAMPKLDLSVLGNVSKTDTNYASLTGFKGTIVLSKENAAAWKAHLPPKAVVEIVDKQAE